MRPRAAARAFLPIVGRPRGQDNPTRALGFHGGSGARRTNRRGDRYNVAAVKLIVAEKPSVARDIARVLAVRGHGRNALEGNGLVITWCVGHLVELEEPAAYDARWKAWRLDTLPMIPSRFKLRPVASSRDQLRAVRDLLGEGRFTEVVNACDAGREGELIFRYVYELAGSKLPIRRLWISSMTDEAIRTGFAALKSGYRYDPLADAARCRSEADWLVGLNATRAVTVRCRTSDRDTLYSIGRVQTPTLAIMVEREKAIREFVPHDYWEVRGTFSNAGGQSFRAIWTRQRTTRFGLRDLAETVRGRDQAIGQAANPTGPLVEWLEEKKTHEPPPHLFDLTSLQRTANRRYGLSASRTLEAAQALYERHKILTYPRTDARHLSNDMAGELPKIFRGVAQLPEYAGLVAPLQDKAPPPSRRVFDDAKVRDHHAIIPTGKVVAPGTLSRDERNIFDLVVRRFLGVFYPDAEFANTEVIVRVGAENDGDARLAEGAKALAGKDQVLTTLTPSPDRYVARGRVRLEPGWQAVAGIGEEMATGSKPKPQKEGDREEETSEISQPLPMLRQGERLDGSFTVESKKTKPPPRHTEATLLAAMETAGRSIDDESLREAMKECGLGTPATRAATIETLLRRKFITRQGRHIVPTTLGMALIDVLPVPSLASAKLTGEWEARLSRIARGEETRAAFMDDIAAYVRQLIAAVRAAPMTGAHARAAPQPSPLPRRDRQKKRTAAKDALMCPRCGQGGIISGKRGWGCSLGRQGCSFVVWFETAGRRLSDTQLRELVTKGRTRKAKWTSDGGAVVAGRLVLDLKAHSGAVRLETT